MDCHQQSINFQKCLAKGTFFIRSTLLLQLAESLITQLPLVLRMMKKMILFSWLAVLLGACTNNATDAASKPESDVDAARMFIDAALKGNYKLAQKLILPDSTNLEGLAQAERLYLNSDVTRQRGLRESSLILHDTKKLSDSVTVVEYSNSFTKQKQAVKTVRINGKWLIDFKYTFQNTNSTNQ